MLNTCVDVDSQAVRVPHHSLVSTGQANGPETCFVCGRTLHLVHTTAANPVVANYNSLLKVDGSLLAYAGDANKDPQVHAALVSNIWGAYISGKDTHDKGAEETDEGGKKDAQDKEAAGKDAQARDAAGKDGRTKKVKPFTNLGCVMIHCEVRCDTIFA